MAELDRVYGTLPARYPRDTRLFPAGDPYRRARADHMAGKVDTIHPHPSQRAAIAIAAAPLDCSRPTRDRRRQRRPGLDRIAFDAAPSAPAVAGHLRRSDAEEPDAFPATAKRVAVDRDQRASEDNRHYQHGYGSKRSALASISSARTEASLDLSTIWTFSDARWPIFGGDRAPGWRYRTRSHGSSLASRPAASICVAGATKICGIPPSFPAGFAGAAACVESATKSPRARRGNSV